MLCHNPRFIELLSYIYGGGNSQAESFIQNRQAAPSVQSAVDPVNPVPK